MKKIFPLLSIITIFLVIGPAFRLVQAQEALPTVEIKDINDVTKIINNVASWMYTILLTVAVIFGLISAYIFLTAGEKPENIKKATKQLYYAVIAVVVAVLAFSIKTIVINFLTK